MQMANVSLVLRSAACESSSPAFQWHGETLELPDGAVLLAASPAYRNQAFRWKKKAYGIQFHVEISADLAKQWSQVPAYRATLERVLGPSAATKVVGDVSSEEKPCTPMPGVCLKTG
jgi:GMP synthase-like glutamine amidotransferase